MCHFNEGTPFEEGFFQPCCNVTSDAKIDALFIVVSCSINISSNLGRNKYKPHNAVDSFICVSDMASWLVKDYSDVHQCVVKVTIDSQLLLCAQVYKVIT